MARTAAAALERFLELLRDPTTGFQAQLQSIATRDGVALRPVAARSLFVLNAPADLVDQSRDAEYPELFVFVEQMENRRREKFGYFSGTLRLAADVRISAEIPDRLEIDLHRYTEALLSVLHSSPGEWLSGLLYTGRYTVSFSPARLGGNNFVQSAKVSFELEQFIAG